MQAVDTKAVVKVRKLEEAGPVDALMGGKGMEVERQWRVVV